MSDAPQMTIGGKSIATDASFDVVNPATGKPFMAAPECTRAQLDAAVDAAAEAFRTWRNDEDFRRKKMLECAAAIEANVERLAPLLTQEQGKPLHKAQGEVFGCSVWLKATAGFQLPVDTIQDDDKVRTEVRRRLIGVVGAITPWNVPLVLAMWKIAPALLTGNTIVIKPSPYTPLATLRLGEVLRDVLPPGVVNVVSGGDVLGAWITEHPKVRKVSFTGSVPTGKKVMAAAAPDLKRVTLELGGNDAAIVLADNDPDAIAEKLFWGAFANSGQVCSAIKRLFVERPIYDKTLEALAGVVARVKVGDGMQAGVELGPVNNAPQFERVRGLVDDAKKRGARVVVGGDTFGDGGYFHQMTLLTELGDDAPIVAEEQFGPALPVLPFDDVDEAIERANATMYGLSGSVWSRDTDRAVDLASRLECGTAWVNQHLAIGPLAPFGGFKHSGIGRENGPHGLSSFVELQTVQIAK